MKMKRHCLILLLFTFMSVWFINMMEVNAVDTGFKTIRLPTEEKESFIVNSNILPTNKEPEKKTITCFDVNSNQLIAVGQNTLGRKTICVYSNKGVFQYGYTFNCSGDFGVEWDEENLNIYFVRSSVIVSVTPTGEVLDVLEVQNTIKNNSYINYFIHATKRTIGNSEYYIGNNMGILNFFAPSYSQIIVRDITGTESVIYDVSSLQQLNMVAVVVIVFTLVCVTVSVIVWQLIKNVSVKHRVKKHSNNNTGNGSVC